MWINRGIFKKYAKDVYLCKVKENLLLDYFLFIKENKLMIYTRYDTIHIEIKN